VEGKWDPRVGDRWSLTWSSVGVRYGAARASNDFAEIGDICIPQDHQFLEGIDVLLICDALSCGISESEADVCLSESIYLSHVDVDVVVSIVE
jgi:hypothetical protein